MRSARGLALALLVATSGGCGSAQGASTPPQARRAGSNRQGTAAGPAAGARPASDATQEWFPCSIAEGRLALWIPAPRGAHVEVERDSCIAMPRAGLEPPEAEWFFGIVIVDAGEDEARALAAEPDGARRFIIEAAEIVSPAQTGEGTLELLGTTARWYGIRGEADDVGLRDFVVARVRHGRGWLVAVAVAHPRDQARLDESVRMLGLARRR